MDLEADIKAIIDQAALEIAQHQAQEYARKYLEHMKSLHSPDYREKFALRRRMRVYAAAAGKSQPGYTGNGD